MTNAESSAPESAFDVIVVGAGVQGLAQAWAACRRGYRVLVLEQSPRAAAASVRNFGMIWPVGQPSGPRLEIALRSRELWLEAARETEIYARECGSLFVAIRDDEAQMMREFAAQSIELGFDVQFVDRRHCERACPILRETSVLGGLSSSTEVNIDPREAVPGLARWLEYAHDVRFAWNTAVSGVETGRVTTTAGPSYRADRILLCQGAAAARLFPSAFDTADLVRCKLQMLRTEPFDQDMGPMLATALTLRHYESFRIAPTLGSYAARIERETPELDEFGIHVMISQDAQGRLILGDSHEYGDSIDDCRSELIDRWILDELQSRFRIEGFAIDARWQGVYLKRPGHAVFVRDPAPDVRIVNGLGGNGMTLSLGLADRMWNDWNDTAILAGLPEDAQQADAS